MPNREEMAEGRRNLKAVDYKVDFVITHEMPTESLKLYCALYKHAGLKPDNLNQYLERLRGRLEYVKWFSGHYHDNRQLTSKDIVVYDQIIRVV